MKPDQNVYYKKTYRKLGIILWHLIIRKKEYFESEIQLLNFYSSFGNDG